MNDHEEQAIPQEFMDYSVAITAANVGEPITLLQKLSANLSIMQGFSDGVGLTIFHVNHDYKFLGLYDVGEIGGT